MIPDERLPIDRADVGGQPPKIEIEAVVYSPNVEKHVKLDDSQVMLFPGIQLTAIKEWIYLSVHSEWTQSATESTVELNFC